ncbi:hypothetical protein LWI29_005893 [Acer saccharum]|uniref:At1g61320/AtMIF1 LRR domain-containing protein n=1 Tax=Acer saccharum TaxID=4024 RepID=A0AA39T1A3_ACESA|nr:hypothetical protein LWI29_005893 [Acer saccharum]
MLQKLMSRCSLLEDLHLSCLALKHIYVSKLHKLKIISIRELAHELQSVQIVVPSLEQFSLNCKESILIDMVECPLMVLKLKRVLLTDHEFRVLISSFPLLEDLKVIFCLHLKRITISSNLLKNLSISFCYKLMAIDIDAPNLLSFCYLDNPIPVSSMNVPCPWKVELSNNYGDDPDTQWYIKIKEFLTGSNQIEDVILTVDTSKRYSFNFDECRESSPSFPREIGNLYVTIYVAYYHYAALLDGLLEVCYPRTLSVSLYERSFGSSFIEWLYEKLMNVDASCCDSHDIKCWRHYLKDFKIGGFLMSHPEDQNPLCLDNFSVDNLEDALRQYRNGIVRIPLNWRFPEFYK